MGLWVLKIIWLLKQFSDNWLNIAWTTNLPNKKLQIKQKNSLWLLAFLIWVTQIPHIPKKAHAFLKCFMLIPWISYDRNKHYIDVIMSTMASQITGLMAIYLTVCSDVYQRKHQSSTSPAFMQGIHWDRWIPRTKGQLSGKCFHLMTSSWNWFKRGKSQKQSAASNSVCVGAWWQYYHWNLIG